MIKLRKVKGDSMAPALNAGDFVVMRCALLRLRVGDIVVCDHPYYGSIIKRICAISDMGMLKLEGANPDSVSSEQLGEIHRSRVIGKVVSSITKRS